MGGKEASRGFLYQAFAAVLEAMSQKTWDKIYIEFDTDNDKVDIALGINDEIFKSIQVKSTVNTFSKNSLRKWLQDLISDDVGSTEFELYLIGQCDKDAIVFINSIGKFQDEKLDKISKESLKGFDTSVIQGKKISFKCIPYDVDILEKIVRDSLFKYVCICDHILTFDQISFIASATVNDQMISSTHGKGVDRQEFDEELEKRILLVADKYSPKRISVGIKSFRRKAVELEDSTKCLSFLDKFDGRKIKDEYDWNSDIFPELKEFLYANTNENHAYQIFLDTHASLAFASGRVLDSKSGINIFPIQKNYGTELWDVKLSTNRNYSNWNVSHEMLDETQDDSVVILNATHNIYNDVLMFIEEEKLPVGRVINCTLNEVGTTSFLIEDGNHAEFLANSIYNAVSQRTSLERRAMLHIFASAPNAFMFFLGRISRGFGKCTLYEYDFEKTDSCSYSKSISFTN